MARQFRLELFQLGTISDVYEFMERGIFTAWDRVAKNLSLPDEDIGGNAWGIKGHNYLWILANVNFTRGGTALDVGGGYSMLPVIINERFGTEVWAVDDFGMESGEPLWSRWGDREKQKARYPNINYVFERLGNISTSSLKKGYFDVIYSVSALEHVPSNQMKAVFDHMLYLLKPGGVLVHCVDIAICSSIAEATDAMGELNLRYMSGWFRFLKEYFGEANLLAGDSIRKPDELESSMNPDIVLESPEVVFKYYPPNRRAKPYTRIGTLTFIIRSLSVSSSFPRLVTMTALDSRGCKFEVSNPVEAFRIEKFGGEEAFTRAMLSELRSTDVFYDIGASVGFVTVHAAWVASQVVTFEPDPDIRARLEKNIGLNALTNVHVVEWAVSDMLGEATLFTDGVAGSSPSLQQVGKRCHVLVQTNSIDNALSSQELPVPDVIKLDIEGAELLALKGMRSLLVSEDAPRVIFIEVHPDFLLKFETTAADVTGYLTTLGYSEVYRTQRGHEIHAIFTKTNIESAPGKSSTNWGGIKDAATSSQASKEVLELLSAELLDKYRPIVESFRQLAQFLGLVVGWHYFLDLAWTASHFSNPTGMTILDAGAGTGLLQWWLAEHGARVISVDRQARSRVSSIIRNRFRIRGLRPSDTPSNLIPQKPRDDSDGEVVFYNSDLSNLAEIETDSVDAVVSISALEHNTLDGLAVSVRELERVLRPGGLFLATMPATKTSDWFHKASKGWCFTEATLREYFNLQEAKTNFAKYDQIFSELKECAELRDNLDPFYFRSGDNGMPWGVWNPQYQPVGIRKIKPDSDKLQSVPQLPTRRCISSAEKVLAMSNALLSQYKALQQNLWVKMGVGRSPSE